MVSSVLVSRISCSTNSGLEIARSYSKTVQDKEGSLAVCDIVSSYLKNELGWYQANGFYVGSDIEVNDKIPYFHCWNILPDGTIVDATANQFSCNREGDIVRVVGIDDPFYASYIDESCWYIDDFGNFIGDLSLPNLYARWESGNPGFDYYVGVSGVSRVVHK